MVVIGFISESFLFARLENFEAYASYLSQREKEKNSEKKKIFFIIIIIIMSRFQETASAFFIWLNLLSPSIILFFSPFARGEGKYSILTGFG